MKVELRIFFLFYIFSHINLLVADGKNYTFAYLNNTLEYLVIRRNGLGFVPVEKPKDLHSKIIDRIKKVPVKVLEPITNQDNEFELIEKEILVQLFEPAKVTQELVREGEAWVRPYFLNDANFDFMHSLKNQNEKLKREFEERIIAGRGNLLRDNNQHNFTFSSIDTTLRDKLTSQISEIEKSLVDLRDNARKNPKLTLLKSISDIGKKDQPSRAVFARLLNLVNKRAANYDLQNIIYPIEINSLEDLKKFEPLRTSRMVDTFVRAEDNIKDGYFYIPLVKDLLTIHNQLKNKLANLTIEELNDGLNGLNAGFNKLKVLIRTFSENFQGIKPTFNQLVQAALEVASTPWLTGKKFDDKLDLEGARDIDTGNKEVIKRKIYNFANSGAVKFYLFSGKPLIRLFNKWSELKTEFAKAKTTLMAQVRLQDSEALKRNVLEQIFEYGASDYSDENELYYSRIFENVLSQLDLKTSKEFKEIINALKNFRDIHLVKLFKARDMILKNPFNEDFKKSIRHLSETNIGKAEEIFVKLAASQFNLKDLINQVAEDITKAVNTETLFGKVKAEVGSKNSKQMVYLSDYLKQKVNFIKNEAENSWNFNTTAQMFKAVIDKLIPSSSGSTEPSKKEKEQDENLMDLIRKGITGRGRTVEEIEEQDWEEEEWDPDKDF